MVKYIDSITQKTTKEFTNPKTNKKNKIKVKTSITMYAHNGAKFDSYFVL